MHLYTAYISRIGILFQGATPAVAFDGNEHGKTHEATKEMYLTLHE
jgi:hypothetical protein